MQGEIALINPKRIAATLVLATLFASLCAAQAPIERRPPAQQATDQLPPLKLESRLVSIAVNAGRIGR